ncbi:ragulator complex protein LAMTOR5 homolog [Dysidea avara]|uniref:ragulator complex protein LAMTOR5 homolog n=1 Tax=Dysidea avara TaxID=196820 RepID=UPI003322649A
MEIAVENQMEDIMAQPGIIGALCADDQGLCVSAHGTLQPSAAGVVKELVSKAQELKHGKAPDDQPVVTIELDTGNILMKSHGDITLAVHKV